MSLIEELDGFGKIRITGHDQSGSERILYIHAYRTANTLLPGVNMGITTKKGETLAMFHMDREDLKALLNLIVDLI